MRVYFKTLGISYRCDTTRLSFFQFCFFFMGGNNLKRNNYSRNKQPNGIIVKRFNNLQNVFIYRVQNGELAGERGTSTWGNPPGRARIHVTSKSPQVLTSIRGGFASLKVKIKATALKGCSKSSN